MRPKVLVIVLISALGLLAGIAVLMKVLAGSDTDAGVAQEIASEEPSNALAATVQVNPAVSNAASLSADEARAAQIAKELEEIRENLASGTGNPLSLIALLDKVKSPEQEVRKAALEAVVQFNDTNAIPQLNAALQQLEDPRDKAAVLEAISYLQLPDTKDELLPPQVQNAQSERRSADNVKSKPPRQPRTNSTATTGRPRPRSKSPQPVGTTP
jgi:hypothetical protein